VVDARGTERGNARGDERIKVLIVEDQVVLADALARLISDEPTLEVVGSVTSVADAITTAAKLEPDVVLMDFILPDGDGLVATREIKRARPATTVVMLTGYGEAAVLQSAIEAGCDGFLTKDRAVFEVVTAVHRAYDGEAVMEPTLLGAVLARMRGQGPPRRTQLTPRESEVLVLLSRGKSNREIAGKMYLSVHTVRSHVQNLITKLDAHSKLEAVAKAVRLGIIPLP
jgi:DNA-binding NarL/FixJ family response regulator